MDLDYLYSKIVKAKRGGICYELNYLLYNLLNQLGFEVKILGGKVLEEEGNYFDHLFLIVNLGQEKYLVDVGFGDNFLEPLKFVINVVQRDRFFKRVSRFS